MVNGTKKYKPWHSSTYQQHSLTLAKRSEYLRPKAAAVLFPLEHREDVIRLGLEPCPTGGWMLVDQYGKPGDDTVKGEARAVPDPIYHTPLPRRTFTSFHDLEATTGPNQAIGGTNTMYWLSERARLVQAFLNDYYVVRRDVNIELRTWWCTRRRQRLNRCHIVTFWVVREESTSDKLVCELLTGYSEDGNTTSSPPLPLPLKSVTPFVHGISTVHSGLAIVRGVQQIGPFGSYFYVEDLDDHKLPLEVEYPVFEKSSGITPQWSIIIRRGVKQADDIRLRMDEALDGPTEQSGGRRIADASPSGPQLVSQLAKGASTSIAATAGGHRRY